MSTIQETSTGRLSLPEATQPVRVFWGYAFSISLLHLLALLALVPWFFSWTGVVVCLLGFYVYGTLGINLAYHRLLTHRGLTVPKWLEYSLTTLGICCLEDTPARWVAIHRMHHQQSDEQNDPHSPLVSFLWSHVGWLILRSREHSLVTQYERYARDLLRDPYYLWVERRLMWLWMYIAHGAIYFFAGLAIGWGSTGSMMSGVQFGASLVVWGVIVRTVCVWHIAWSVNSFGHIWGYRNYETKDQSRNNWFVGLISNGEGWHNNHHWDQRCARHGHKWWELDVTWITIRFLERIGLAKNVAGLDHKPTVP